MKIGFAELLARLGRKAGTDGFCLHGRLEARLTKPDGSVIVRVKDNLIVNAGFSFIAQSVGLSTGRPGVMSHIAVGTGTTAAAAANTTLLDHGTLYVAKFNADGKVTEMRAYFGPSNMAGF